MWCLYPVPTQLLTQRGLGGKQMERWDALTRGSDVTSSGVARVQAVWHSEPRSGGGLGVGVVQP